MFEAARADIVSIFILPPSMEELRNRLIRRAEDLHGAVGVTLDDVTFDELNAHTSADIRLVSCDATALVDALFGTAGGA